MAEHFDVKTVHGIEQDLVRAFCAGDEPGAAPHRFGLLPFIQGSQRAQGHDPQLRQGSFSLLAALCVNHLY
jgi:hypothetical protein